MTYFCLLKLVLMFLMRTYFHSLVVLYVYFLFIDLDFPAGLMVIIWTEPEGEKATVYAEEDGITDVTADDVELTGFLKDRHLYEDDDDDLRSLEGQD